MSADVYMTGANGDLKMTDAIVEIDPARELTRTSQAALAQQLHTAVMIGEGEWFVNALEGVPWVRLTTPKIRNLGAIAEEVRRALRSVPQVREVRNVSVTQSGRAISISLDVRVRGRNLVGQILVDPSAKEKSIVGDNAVYSVIFPVLGVDPI